MNRAERTMEDYLEAMSQPDMPRCRECGCRMVYDYSTDQILCPKCGRKEGE